MQKVRFSKVRGWLLGAALLEACGQEPTGTVTPGPVSSAANSAAAITTTGPVPNTAFVELPDTPTPAATPSPVPTNTAAPVASPTPGATATPAVPAFEPNWRSIGMAGGMQDFSFAADGRLVFYDKPSNDTRAGTWTLDLQAGRWAFLTAGFGNFSPDLSLGALSNRGAGTTTIQDLAGSKKLATLSNKASPAIFSPDKKQVAYLLRVPLPQDGPETPQRFEVWVAGVDGANARAVWRGRELDSLAWFSDSQRLLVTGRDYDDRQFGLWSINAASSAATLLHNSKGLNVAALSGDGNWLAWWVTLQGPEQSGVWVARSDGSQARKMDWAGGWRWSDGAELLYVPLRQPGESANALWSYDPATGHSTRLTDPARLPLRIALDQWQVAPGAKSLVFRNTADNALWQLNFRQ